MKSLIRSAAVAFLVLCVGYYLWHGLTYVSPPDDITDGVFAWVGWQMSLPIIAVTVTILAFAFTADGIMTAFTGHNSPAFRDGLIGLGTITAVGQTGLTVNDQPQLRLDLRVEGADGVLFDSSAKVIVALTELAALRPGIVVPVRYLPGRTDRVEIDRSGDPAAAQQVLNQSLVRQGITTAANLETARHGIATQAVVQSLEPTGEIRDGNAKLAIGLVVTRPDGGTFTAHVQKFLPPYAVAQVQIGRVVRVHYQPEHEDELVLALSVNQ
jgi:hypothetical protein